MYSHEVERGDLALERHVGAQRFFEDIDSRMFPLFRYQSMVLKKNKLRSTVSHRIHHGRIGILTTSS